VAAQILVMKGRGREPMKGILKNISLRGTPLKGEGRRRRGRGEGALRKPSSSLQL
jgi:hypothetical protein